MASQNSAQSSLRNFLKISVKAAFLVELYSKIDLTKYFTNDTNIFVFTHCYSDFTNFSTLKQFAFLTASEAQAVLEKAILFSGSKSSNVIIKPF